MARSGTCIECGGRMEEGFIADSDRNFFQEGRWHPGSPEDATFLGMKVGTKVDRESLLPIRSLRCTACGLLRFYAER